MKFLNLVTSSRKLIYSMDLAEWFISNNLWKFSTRSSARKLIINFWFYSMNLADLFYLSFSPLFRPILKLFTPLSPPSSLICRVISKSDHWSIIHQFYSASFQPNCILLDWVPLWIDGVRCVWGKGEKLIMSRGQRTTRGWFSYF